MFLDLIRLTVSIVFSHYSNVFGFSSELCNQLVQRLASHVTCRQGQLHSRRRTDTVSFSCWFDFKSAPGKISGNKREW